MSSSHRARTWTITHGQESLPLWAQEFSREVLAHHWRKSKCEIGIAEEGHRNSVPLPSSPLPQSSIAQCQEDSFWPLTCPVEAKWELVSKHVSLPAVPDSHRDQVLSHPKPEYWVVNYKIRGQRVTGRTAARGQNRTLSKVCGSYVKCWGCPWARWGNQQVRRPQRLRAGFQMESVKHLVGATYLCCVLKEEERDN